jgi:hypothetical protein
VTIAIRPSFRGGTAVDIGLIWVGGEGEFFASRRWTEGQISALEFPALGANTAEPEKRKSLNYAWGYLKPEVAVTVSAVLSCYFQSWIVDMARKAQSYTVKVTGPGHDFERSIDEVAASQILALIMTGAAAPAGRGGASDGGVGAKRAVGANVSLAAYIKAKKAEQNQTMRFLATASWLSGRSSNQLTTKAVAKALSDYHQKRLSNPADCLNKNVSKGLCEKRGDGSFFITPEGLQALGEGATESS